MKKLIFAFAIACTAIAAQSASYEWKCVEDGVYLPGQSENYFSGTAYLINGTKTSQTTLLEAFSGAGFNIADYQISTGTLNDWHGAALTSFEYDGQVGGSIWNAYMAVINGDNIFISSLTADITAPADLATETISIKDPSSASSAALKTEYSGFEGSGWYAATQPVPEPTSGLLVLMGLAGLMLRRKRA